MTDTNTSWMARLFAGQQIQQAAGRRQQVRGKPVVATEASWPR